MSAFVCVLSLSYLPTISISLLPLYISLSIYLDFANVSKPYTPRPHTHTYISMWFVYSVHLHFQSLESKNAHTGDCIS
jgi:hypothetical protein